MMKGSPGTSSVSPKNHPVSRYVRDAVFCILGAAAALGVVALRKPNYSLGSAPAGPSTPKTTDQSDDHDSDSSDLDLDGSGSRKSLSRQSFTSVEQQARAQEIANELGATDPEMIAEILEKVRNGCTEIVDDTFDAAKKPSVRMENPACKKPIATQEGLRRFLKPVRYEGLSEKEKDWLDRYRDSHPKNDIDALFTEMNFDDLYERIDSLGDIEGANPDKIQEARQYLRNALDQLRQIHTAYQQGDVQQTCDLLQQFDNEFLSLFIRDGGDLAEALDVHQIGELNFLIPRLMLGHLRNGVMFTTGCFEFDFPRD